MNVTGYPYDQPAGTLWNDQNRLLDIESQRLIYENDTEKGQSGSPILLFSQDRSLPPVVIGIHAYGVDHQLKSNSGVRMNERVLRYLNFWMQREP